MEAFKETDKPESLEPTQQELSSALQEARAYWHNLGQHAVAQYKKGIPPQSVAPQELLKHAPSIPDCHVDEYLSPLDIFQSTGVLFVKARVTWSVPEEGDCGVCEKHKIRPAALPTGIRQPASIRLGNDNFCVKSDQEDVSSRQNMVGVLALGWLYIFSAEIVERGLQKNATMVYTNSRAEITSLEDDFHDVIDIGDVDQETARWWTAILAPEQGWKATVFQADHEDPFVSP
ncbi:hypothetical protein PHISCL_00850 [Aspergillus sclerotialis]|uniref:Uncharacterized protein n=1 Tax=Aspergillus sclerotialis TaxID=2070753 RepID=A0A3A3AA05_9EURO|nr:hypothetical protein PHISCL_00850 [Aspergillus sclerotialis]